MVALEQASSAVYYAGLACSEQLKAAPHTHGNSATGLWGVVQTNRIAAKCLIESSKARSKKTRPEDRNPENHQLRGTSYATMEEAFKGIPATFQFPFLGFLNCN